MHALLLIGIIPFFTLLAVMAFAVLILLSAVVLEFPLLLLAALALGIAGRYLENFQRKREILCEQI
jgi:hypothetical protein